MKRIISAWLCLIMLLTLLAGCVGENPANPDNGEKTKDTVFQLISGASEINLEAKDGKLYITSAGKTGAEPLIADNEYRLPDHYEKKGSVESESVPLTYVYQGSEKTENDDYTLLKLSFTDEKEKVTVNACFTAYKKITDAFSVRFECENDRDEVIIIPRDELMSFDISFSEGETMKYVSKSYSRNYKNAAKDEYELYVMDGSIMKFDSGTGKTSSELLTLDRDNSAAATVSCTKGSLLLTGGYEDCSVRITENGGKLNMTAYQNYAEYFMVAPHGVNSVQNIVFSFSNKPTQVVQETDTAWEYIKTARSSNKNVLAESEKYKVKEEKQFNLPDEKMSTASLCDYTIVYPSVYADWQMTEVNLLRETLTKITGKEIEAISDKESEREHEIIFASSERKTALDDYIAYFDSRLDYVISVSEGDIVLGGQDYYGDMRAAYTFINEYLGYDDVIDEYSDPKPEISGTNSYIYEEPSFAMVCTNFYAIKFETKEQVRDVRDCNFNVFCVQGGLLGTYETMEEFRQLCLWCCRFDLRLMIAIDADEENATFTLRYLDAYADNPIVWGHYLRDEPAETLIGCYTKIISDYNRKYSLNGWRSLMNLCGGSSYVLEDDTIFAESSLISYDMYFADGRREKYPPEVDGVSEENIVRHYQEYTEAIHDRGCECWSYIMAYYFERFNSEKMIPWSQYINMCFGVSGIMYFNYQGHVVSGDLSRREYWYYSQKANAEMMELGTKLVEEYDYLGISTLNAQPLDIFFGKRHEYKEFNEIVETVLPEGCTSPYLLGGYQRKDGKGEAYIIVNTDRLDDVPYAETTSEPLQMRFVDEGTVTVYRDGQPLDLQPDENGFLSVGIGNGQRIFVTVDR